ncbi:uncharacterized protein LOC130446353 isoform X4 [Diorhabda sublineata]|uniref:uncharacterized protein LOC130446353 isoform X4 n=2 Tax=Diorhabda TaxID=217246 RepID=UPI0024E0BCB1|nr:uncharacterized protein LOC130446353 isoform X4 [Diorhabda sublineata]
MARCDLRQESISRGLTTDFSEYQHVHIDDFNFFKGMDSQRKISNVPSPPKNTSSNSNQQGFATLIVMIAVLFIIVLFCCFAAPGIRMMCKRYIFRRCLPNDHNIDNVYARRYGYDTRDEINEVSELKKKVAQEQTRSAHPL